MRRSETDKRVIDNDEVVAIQILLDGSLTKLPQSSPVPVDLYFGVLFFIFGNSSEQRGIATRMIPGEPFKSNSHDSLLAFETFLAPGQAAGRFSASKICSQYSTTSSR